MKRRMTQGLLAATFAAAMGFGAAQAMAAPAAEAKAAGWQQDVCTRRGADRDLLGLRPLLPLTSSGAIAEGTRMQLASSSPVSSLQTCHLARGAARENSANSAHSA